MRSNDPLLHVSDAAPPLGRWIEQAACAAVDVDLDIAGVYTADDPDPLELELARSVCARCPVRSSCADYAARVPVYGLWGARWRGSRTRPGHVQARDDSRSASGGSMTCASSRSGGTLSAAGSATGRST